MDFFIRQFLGLSDFLLLSLYGDFCKVRLPPMGPFFELQQHNVPQKITFFMNIYDYSAVQATSVLTKASVSYEMRVI